MQSDEARYRIEQIPRSLVASLRRDGGFIIGIQYYPGAKDLIKEFPVKSLNDGQLLQRVTKHWQTQEYIF